MDELKHLILVGPGKAFGKEIIDLFTSRNWLVSTISRSPMETNAHTKHQHF